MAPLQGKLLQAPAAPSSHLQLLPAGCRSESRKRERLRGEGGLTGTVAGRLLPVLPHDPGPNNADAKEKVISRRQLTALECGVLGQYLS